MPTVLDVAKRAGVSPITVSRVINNSGYISQVTRERVEAAVRELGYVPNTLARGLRSKRTKTLALVVTDITNPYFTLMARGVEDVAGDSDYTVVYCNTDESEAKEEKYANILAQRQVDGVLLVPSGGNVKTIKFLLSNGICVVALDRHLSGIEIDSVRSDSVDGAKRLIKLLIRLGHKQIAIITGPREVSTSVERVTGYRQALTEAGLNGTELVYYGAFNQQSGYEFTNQAMRHASKPTAILGANNFITIGILKALHDLNVEVPGDVSVVGFDDLPESMLVAPFLTVAAQPAYEMGRVAAELLLKRISGEISEEPQELILRTDIIERGSTAPNRMSSSASPGAR
ncbi:MAG TPA: LacI family DNA-binding transcriptional regulator [Anaerolineales bacterium]|nr:LacI family DNA-binding transcriptional regulator [Anaerolineales bacterium]